MGGTQPKHFSPQGSSTLWLHECTLCPENCQQVEVQGEHLIKLHVLNRVQSKQIFWLAFQGRIGICVSPPPRNMTHKHTLFQYALSVPKYFPQKTPFV